MTTEMLRIETMNEDERTIIGLLSMQERKNILVRSAQVKQRRIDNRLMKQHLDRIRSGEVAPQVNDADGFPYPTNGRTVFYKNEKEPMIDLGRVPDHDGVHVLRRKDDSLFFTGGFYLREEGEAWEDLLDDE